ncbi:hypothetical protein [Acetobacter sp. DsW_063]|uniref:hypothetical protein n=1 Tax=Acetobacter sp. DsW_063 TaxID=1514894 RepID=UPI000A37FFFA|nr:hypothetical protein [Acetobacter sp. DsW_063]OUJ14296.1 hypothetical protein HK28_14185 [Acetobacter sp. DsW_063]
MNRIVARRVLPALLLLCLGVSDGRAQPAGQLAGDEPTSGAQITTITAPGNLESTATLGCVTLDRATAKNNPVDLFLAAKACIDAGRFEEAAPLHLLAVLYGHFDMNRVSDETAHQAIIAAQMEIYGDLSKAQETAFNAQLKLMVHDPKTHAAFCTVASRIGPPDYVPRYMIQHGMGAFVGNGGDGLVKEFNPAATWSKIMKDQMKCPV